MEVAAKKFSGGHLLWDSNNTVREDTEYKTEVIKSQNFFGCSLVIFTVTDIISDKVMQRSDMSLLILLSKNCRWVNMANLTAKRRASEPFS